MPQKNTDYEIADVSNAFSKICKDSNLWNINLGSVDGHMTMQSHIQGIACFDFEGKRYYYLSVGCEANAPGQCIGYILSSVGPITEDVQPTNRDDQYTCTDRFLLNQVKFQETNKGHITWVKKTVAHPGGMQIFPYTDLDGVPRQYLMSSATYVNKNPGGNLLFFDLENPTTPAIVDSLTTATKSQKIACAGMCRYSGENNVLIAVSDYGTELIEFISSDAPLHDPNCKLKTIGTLENPDKNVANWAHPEGISLIRQTDGEFYLIAFIPHGIAKLYHISVVEGSSRLEFISEREVNQVGGWSGPEFRWGASTQIIDGELYAFSVSRGTDNLASNHLASSISFSRFKNA